MVVVVVVVVLLLALAAKRKRKAIEKLHLRPIQQAQMDLMKRLDEQGYSVEAIQSQLQPPQVGKKKKSKIAFAKQWNKRKKEQELKEKAKKAKLEEHEAEEISVEVANRNAKLLFIVIFRTTFNLGANPIWGEALPPSPQ